MSELPTFEEYWKNLVDRVYHRHEILQDKEERFYRLSCIYGETMVDGIEAYFDRRFAEFDADMQALCSVGFLDVATLFQKARSIIFANANLEQHLVEAIISGLLDETDETKSIRDRLDEVYEHLIPCLEQMAHHKYQIGLEEGFYRPDTA